jgi:diketogulonate reductase-like aldo/keto reductase
MYAWNKLGGKSAGQVSLRFLIQQGAIVIPRTPEPERLAENLAIFDFALTPAEMEAVRELAHPRGRIVHWSGAPDWD